MTQDFPYRDLRDWVALARGLGGLRDVEGASQNGDIGLIAEMLHHADESPAVLFGDIPDLSGTGRILVNANGNRQRLALTLGLPTDIGRRELMSQFTAMTETSRSIPPQIQPEGSVLDNSMQGEQVDVLQFPAPIWHRGDGGPYIGTGVAVIMKDPDSGWINIGTYRAMVQDKDHVGVFIIPGKHGALIRDTYFKRKEPCPIAIVCGMDPLLFVTSTLEAPYGFSEYDWVGGIRGEPYPVVEGPVTGLPIPATAEIVLEGFLRHDHYAPEGPFGEWTGYYVNERSEQPVLTIDAIHYRDDPIVLGVPPSRPPCEPHRFREYLRSALLLRGIQAAGVPGVVDANCMAIGGNRLFNVVSIQQKYAGHSTQALHVAAMCQAGAYMGRIVVVVDDDIDITDLDDVMWAILTRADPARSMDIIKRAYGGPMDSAMHPDERIFNSRLLIDACRPYEWRDRFPPTSSSDAESKRLTKLKWGWLLHGANGETQTSESDRPDA